MKRPFGIVGQWLALITVLHAVPSAFAASNNLGGFKLDGLPESRHTVRGVLIYGMVH